jgi:hypothetical protein
VEAATTDNVLWFGPESPFVLQAMAALLLAAHIAGGSLGIVSGGVALLAPKGQRVHRAAGKVFLVSMLAMTGVAAVVAPFTNAPSIGNAVMGAFTFYLVATAFATVRRPAGRIGRFEVGAFVAVLGLVAIGLLGVARPAGDSGAAGSAVFALIAGIAASGDYRVIKSGGVAGPARIRRHLWRMCLALFVATGSGFLGQMDEIPEPLRGPHLFVLAFAPLAAMAFWMFRVRSARTATAAPAAA